MGFFATQSTAPKSRVNQERPSNEFLHKTGCRSCPLNNVKSLHHPKLDATGSNNPIVYMLGEANGEVEDLKGEQFIGPSGDLLRPLIPGRYLKQLRWNNTINCRPPNNRDPEIIEIECCRPRLVVDIEKTKPKAIFGFGNIPLKWALNQSGITKWRGRRIPIKVGNHECWFYPMFHPSFLLRQRKGRNRSIKSDNEIALEFDLKHAFAEVFNELPKPYIHTTKEIDSNIICVDGSNKDDISVVCEFLGFQGEQYVGFDYETQNVRPYSNGSEILTIGVANYDTALSFAWKHPQAKWSEQQFEKLNEAFLNFLLSPVRKVVHNLSFEMEQTSLNFGKDKLRSSPNWEDTLSQAFVLDERSGGGDPGALSLELLVLQYFGFNLKDLGRSLNKKNMKGEPLKDILPYNARDARYHLYLFYEQQKRLEQLGLKKQYELMLRRVPTCVLTQMKGLKVDFEVNKQLSRKYELKINEIEKAISNNSAAIEFRKLTGHNFNYGSSKDVTILLKDIIKTSEGRKEDGSYSTDEDVLAKVNHSLAKLIVAGRKATKMKSTYIDPLSKTSENSVIFPDNKLHHSLNTVFARTGRTSANDPNVQNFPKRDSEEKEVRRQIIP
jgi:uracil-DNA glycosylase family 4